MRRCASAPISAARGGARDRLSCRRSRSSIRTATSRRSSCPSTMRAACSFTPSGARRKAMNEEPLRSQQLKFVGLDARYARRLRHFAPHGRQPRQARRSPTGSVRTARRCAPVARFSGLPGIIAEDMAVSVSSGPIRDRSRERLSTADVAIQRLYRTLVGLARAVERGETPLGLSPDVDDSADHVAPMAFSPTVRPGRASCPATWLAGATQSARRRNRSWRRAPSIRVWRAARRSRTCAGSHKGDCRARCSISSTAAPAPRRRCATTSRPSPSRGLRRAMAST